MMATWRVQSSGINHAWWGLRSPSSWGGRKEWQVIHEGVLSWIQWWALAMITTAISRISFSVGENPQRRKTKWTVAELKTGPNQRSNESLLCFVVGTDLLLKIWKSFIALTEKPSFFLLWEKTLLFFFYQIGGDRIICWFHNSHWNSDRKKKSLDVHRYILQ